MNTGTPLALFLQIELLFFFSFFFLFVFVDKHTVRRIRLLLHKCEYEGLCAKGGDGSAAVYPETLDHANLIII